MRVFPNSALDLFKSFARVIKLYTHRCFQKYPQFQLDDLGRPQTTSTRPLQLLQGCESHRQNLLIGRDSEDQVKGPLNSNCEDKTEEKNNLEEDYEEWKEDPWYRTEKNQDSEQHAQSKREDDSDTEKENASLTEITSSLKEKESSPIEEQDANQSSFIEPTIMVDANFVPSPSQRQISTLKSS